MQIQWDNIPFELQNTPHWVLWRMETRDDKPTKVPYNAQSGARAKSNDPATWCDLGRARRVFENPKSTFDGVGWMLSRDAGIVGVDLDHVLNRETGEIADWASVIVDELATYTEITPSGDGLRCFGRGALPPGGRKRGDLEMYDHARFLTVTGQKIGTFEGALPDISTPIAAIHARHFPAEEPAPPPAPMGAATMDDREILDKMFACKGGAKWAALYVGSWQGYFTSQSEADSALCFSLAFWTGRDGAAVDRLFRTSALMRPKWDKSHGADGRSYGQMTVERACDKTANTYQPAPPPPIIRSSRRVRDHVRGEGAKAKNGGGESDEDADGEAEVEPVPTSDEEAIDAGIYAILNGRTVLAVQKSKSSATGSEESGQRHFVCDFSAFIAGEVRDENGVALYSVQGRTRSGRAFFLELDAMKMSDAKYVAGQFLNATGAGTIIYAGMEKHLAPALHQFTDRNDLQTTRRFNRTGWTKEGEFLIPGLPLPDTEIVLSKPLAYRIETGEHDVSELLDKLLSAHNSSLTTIALAHLLLAPLAKKAKVQDEKFALFAVGRSGTFKTSWAQMGMCIYGDFGADDKLLRFGAGGTVNALMEFPAHAADMPLLFDNFKPGTGNGQRDGQTMIHALLEGTERKRLNRDGTQRATQDYRCWPIFTGEDTMSDTASVSRMLIIMAAWESGKENPDLTWCQSNAHLLPRIGGAYIPWLLTAEALAAIQRVMPTFGSKRGTWVGVLRKHCADMVNALRVASSLALCECAWEIASQCPALAKVMDWWTPAFHAALESCARGMTGYSAQSHEATRYIGALRGMIVGQRAYLQQPTYDADKDDRRTFLGWEDDEMVYLLPDVAFGAALDALKNQNGLNGLGQNAISRQLDQLGFLAKKDGGNYAVKRKMGTGRVRVLIIPRAKFFDDESENKND